MLLEWYRTARRDLPWRRTRDPYAIWVSEVMLQQTQVATVLPYYERWMRRFPSLEALANAHDDDVLYAWQGLGYYSRARSLVAGARAVTERHGGRVPDDVERLCMLPGIGPYTAGAIASIAYGKREPIVDGNIARVVCRLFALRGDPARAPLRAKIWDIAGSLVPETAAGDFNQALMELGATICTPRAPRCNECALSGHCAARRAGLAERLPETRARPATTAVRMVAAIVVRSGRVLVVRVPDTARRWAGMWQFAATEIARGETPERAVSRAAREIAGIEVEPHALTAVVRHSVTRFRITLDAYRCHPKGHASRRDNVAWKRLSELDELAMPSAHRRIAAKLQKRRTTGRR